MVSDDEDGSSVLDDMLDSSFRPVRSQGHIGETSFEDCQDGDNQLFGWYKPRISFDHMIDDWLIPESNNVVSIRVWIDVVIFNLGEQHSCHFVCLLI